MFPVLEPAEIDRLARFGERKSYGAGERIVATGGIPAGADLIVARDRTVVRRGVIAEVEHDLVDVTPSPAFGRVIAFDNRMARRVKVLGRVAVRRVVATADMAAGSA
ncbi:MAG TPA: hypothetical protein VGP52_17110 [Stellaceae bacterium]|nr:hypothetical protein [Stellaceae bacterium]